MQAPLAHLVEVDPDTALPAIIGQLQTALRTAGVQMPLVEVLPAGTSLSAYHPLARQTGSLT